MRLKPPRHSAAFFALLLLLASILSISSTRPVQASSPISFIQVVEGGQPSGTSLVLPSITDVTNDVLVVSIFGLGVFNGFAMTDTQGNTYTKQIVSITAQGAGYSTYIWTASVATGGSDTLTITTGGITRIFGAALSEYRFVTGFGVTGAYQNDNAALTGTATVNLVNGALTGSVIIDNIAANPGTTPVTFTNTNGQTNRDTLTTMCATGVDNSGCEYTDVLSPGGSFSLNFGWSAPGPTNCPGCTVSSVALEMLGAPGAPVSSITQCYGNCGSPAVTLANTNSTHGINWNQSLTLFYRFQPTISGFLVNVTTSLAKSYPSSGYAPFLTFYQTNCPLGQTPFSSTCPGLAMISGQASSANKGKQSIIGGSQPVTSDSTHWYAVALTFQIAPEDVNDTNTALAIYQTSGTAPSTFSSSALFSASSKIGVWAFVTGNIVGSLPPPATIPSCAANPQLDCILTNAVNSFCSVVTTNCQTSSALLWMIILAAITFFGLIYVLEQWIPGINLSRLGLGEIGILIFLAWFAIFTSFALLPVYLLILTFMIVSLLFSKRVTGYV